MAEGDKPKALQDVPAQGRIVIPAYLNPGFTSTSAFSTIAPGLHLQPIATEQAKRVQRDIRAPFAVRVLICVDPEAFEAGAKARLEPSGYYAPMALDDPKDASYFQGGDSIAKWIMTGLVLTKTFSFVYGPIYRMRRQGVDLHAQKVQSGAWTDIRSVSLKGVAQYRFEGMPTPDLSQGFDFDEFTAILLAIEPYFRPGLFRVDRMAVALTSLWSSLCTEHPEQAYASLSVALEALLSTQDMEITHQLAERSACMLSSPGTEALAVYRKVKHLYATRSNIVHGRGMSKDDRTKVARAAKRKAPSVPADYPLHMHPLSTQVPMEELRDFTEITIQMICGFLGHTELMGAVQRHDDQHLDRFFLELLLGWEEPGQPVAPDAQTAIPSEPATPSQSALSESDEQANR